MSPRVFLILPALAAFALDVTLTLLGQPSEYWRGDYGCAQEMAPVGRALLTYHPLAFVGAAAGYALLFSLAIRFLPGWLALWISIGFLIAHTSGANSWLLYVDVRLEAIHNVAAAGLAAFCYAAFFRRSKTEAPREGAEKPSENQARR